MRTFLLSILIYASALFPTEADDFLSQAWGIFTDPLKLNKSTSNMIEAIDRTDVYVERIEGKTNSDTKDRINQIGGIIRDTRNFVKDYTDVTFDRAQRFFDGSTARIDQLQIDIFKNTSDLLKCSTEVTSDIAREKLSQALNNIGMRRPRLTFFGITIMAVKFDKTDFDSPISGFREFKRLMDDRLAQVKPSDPPSSIVDVYGEIQRNADLVRCHYKPDTATYAELLSYELEYNRRDRYWRGAPVLQ